MAGKNSFFILALLGLLAAAASGQSFNVIHNFTGRQDGSEPSAGVTIDWAANLYGTAGSGGYTGGSCRGGCGTVFRLTQKNSQWLFTPLYSFQGGNDGTTPEAPVTIGSDGTLYGTTTYGGSTGGGTVYRLGPGAGVCKSALCSWDESVLYSFRNDCCSGDAIYPAAGVVFDQAGNLYGTTLSGSGGNGGGAVYELARSGGGWTESILHGFGLPDGVSPYSGLIFNNAGNLYGTTARGGSYDEGIAYELTPSGAGWTETILHSFNGSDGEFIDAGLIFDQSGNLYGAANAGGPFALGTVFELTLSNGSWSISRLYAFSSGQANLPTGSLVMDSAGNLYGTGISGGAFGFGAVFKLTPSNGSWTYTDLHDFSGNDGKSPSSALVLGANGNLYGTTFLGGAYGYGAVFEITP